MILHDDDTVMEIRYHVNGTVSIKSQCCNAWHTTEEGSLESIAALRHVLGLQGIGHEWTEEEIKLQQIPDPSMAGYGDQVTGWLRKIGAEGIETEEVLPGLTVVSGTVSPAELIKSLGGIEELLGDVKERATQDHDEGDSGWFAPHVLPEHKEES